MSNSLSVKVSGQTIDLETLKTRIHAGEFFSIAADESVLSQLPSGNWIAGTIPYFMSEQGGTVSKEQIFVHTIEGINPNNPPRLTLYDKDSISRIATDAPAHGFTIVILPAGSDVHLTYAEKAPEFQNMFFTPIVGWISGFHLSEDNPSAKVGFGPGGAMLLDQQAVAIHVPLPETQVANINIINLFEEVDGPVIEFPETGFSSESCLIDGKTESLSAYIKDNNVDTKVPLVADYSGIHVNVSIQDFTDGKVDFYAPVFKNVKYRFAKPVNDYVGGFDKIANKEIDNNISFSCNCILNFLYSELEGKKTGNITGPITFGEIAYQLLNQTLVYMTITDL